MGRGLFGSEFGSSIADYAAILDSDIPNLTAGLLQMGVLVAFGSTRDRGALSITITNDGEWDRAYFRESDAACDYLRRATDILVGRGLTTSTPDLPATPLATKRRSRLA